MQKIAYLASQVTLPGAPNRRSDAFEHDYMMQALQPAFEARNLHLEDVSWDAEDVDWTTYQAAIIGTTWDYWDRLDEFLTTLETIGTRTRLFNPAALVRWNSRKTYLRDLEAKGARLIPTLWLDTCDEAEASAAFDTLQAETLVFKRQVGAGAKDQHRLNRGDAIPPMPHPMMAQPFLPIIQEEGELSFIFVDGQFSHAVRKRAKTGDYRIQSSYGGYEEALTPSEDDLTAARAIISILEDTPLYGRVDMLRSAQGDLLLMELEVIEPYLYPKEGPDLGPRMADSILRRINS